MSRYPPEPDEAQHRYYNDGHFVNPYDSYDPFNSPRPTYSSSLVVPPPPPPPPLNQQPYHSSYSSPSPPPPPPPGASSSFAGPSVGAFATGQSSSPRPSFGIPGPSPAVNYPLPNVSQPVDLPPTNSSPSIRYRPSLPSMYDAHDDYDHDSGNMPLLNRPSSQARLRIPSQLDEEDDPPSVVDDSRSESNVRYGSIPQRVPRRYKTLKKVELFHGNFVLDNPVPKKLLDSCPNRTDREFTHMRYSAATCDPNDFKDDGFTLRQVHYDPPRRTELFIVMTMYNEDEELFTRSMHGVIKNVAHLCKRDRSKTWGKDGWKKVVVCIVSDGRAKVNLRTLSVLAVMGCYQEGIAKTKIGKRDTTAHIYEYTTQISVTPSLKIERSERGVVPVQVIFCLKEKNQKKINSHRWFFNAFGPILQPNVCVLLDVGTMPGPTSIYHLWKAFDINSNVGGACGEIVALKGKYGTNLLNPLVAAQNFEYKMSNILDKPLESIFGYITVLPGAFSAYRYIAIQNEKSGESGPLYKYFLGEKKHGSGGIFTANMYLAEDRILCWELVSKRGCSWILHYVKSAYGVTDVPDQVPELISQRRRWLNGSFFAAIHSTVHFYYIYRSSHSLTRKFWIHVEMAYQFLNLIFSWFALANYYIAFSILSTALEDPTFGLNGIHIANVLLNYFYLGLLIMCFILALGNRPQGSKWGYTLAIIGFGIITIYMTVAALVLAFKGLDELIKDHKGSLSLGDFFTNPIFRNIVLSLSATLGLYVFASLIFFEPWHLITSFAQYTLMAPSYINVLNVYAFANVHDISWGTKGDNVVSLGTVSTGKTGEVIAAVPDEKDMDELYDDAIHVLKEKKVKEEKKVDPVQQQEDYYRNVRTNVLLAWVLSNCLLAATITSTNASAATAGANAAVSGYMTFLLYTVALLAFIRFCGSTGYIIVRMFAGE